MIGFVFRHPILTLCVAGAAYFYYSESQHALANAEKPALSEVLGIDTTGSGLRDDVESWIASLYPYHDHPVRQTAELVGRAFQMGMHAFHTNSPQLRDAAIEAYGVAHTCLTTKFDAPAAERLLSGMEKAMGDTAERAQYIVNLKAWHAQSMHFQPRVYACPF